MRIKALLVVVFFVLACFALVMGAFVSKPDGWGAVVFLAVMGVFGCMVMLVWAVRDGKE